MTPEQLSRLRTYDPDFDCPNPLPPESPPRDHGALERRVAVIFTALAIAIISFVIVKSLP